MNYRALGKTGTVSEIGFGAWGIGGSMWKGGDDQEALAALNRAVDLGLNFIDTALAYGQGHSEKLISKILKKRSERLTVATKIPPKNQEWPARHDSSVQETFPTAHLRFCTEQSLKNLGVECLDLQQLHVWAANWMNDLEWVEALKALQREGKVARFGISINDHDPDSALEVVRAGLVDTVQVIYNIFDPSPAPRLFPLCQEKNVGVIVRCPFDEGALTGAITEKTRFETGDWRESYFTPSRKKEIVTRLEKLRSVAREAKSETLSELALRFCLSHPAVSVVIPGMRRVAHVDQNLPVSTKGPLSPDLLGVLSNHAWGRNFYL